MSTGINLAGRRVLVTGAAGFIGSALCRALRALGASLYGVSRAPQHNDLCDQWLQSDLTQLDDVRRLIKNAQPDLIFHLASHVVGGRAVEMVPTTFAANLGSSVNLLTAATELGGARVVLTGSLEEPDPSNEWAVPSSPYAAAKYAASTYGRMFHHLYQTPVVMLRLFMVYGPGQGDRKKLIPFVINSMLEGRAPDLSTGTRLVDWIFVDDVVRAYVAAAVAPRIEGRTLDIGSGKLVTIRTVVEQLMKLSGSTVQPRFGVVPERPFEQERVANVAATAMALDWQPRTELRQGLSRTLEWYRAQSERGALRTEVASK